MFRRTGADVARVSNNQQRPAVYNQFYGTAYLGARPTTPIQPTPTPAPTERIYKVGDVGPASSIIFYDKGSYSNGWRYLEATPVETDKRDDNAFSSHSSYAEINDRSLGAGLTNTRLYLEKLSRNNVTGNTAPKICDALVVNGYNDWYLPSLDELLRMYTVLRNNGNAGFQSSRYWTSTCYSNREQNPGAAIFVDFSNGVAGIGYLGDTLRIRACRRF
jgi:hypothetical protein